MENEEKNVVVEEEKKEETQVVEEKPNDTEGNDKAALTGFILTVIASGLCFASLGAFTGLILVLIAKRFNEQGKASNHRVFKVFNKIANIAAPIIMIASIVFFVLFLILFIVEIIQKAAA